MPAEKISPTGRYNPGASSWLKIKTHIKTRMIMMEEAARMAVAQCDDKAGASLLFLAKIQVTMVLDTRPPTIQVSRMPRSCPKNLIRRYPKKPKPDVRTMIHPISCGLITLKGPIP